MTSLKLIEEKDASEEIKKIYLEIKEALGAFDVGVLFKSLASRPKSFRLIWEHIKTNVESEGFAKDSQLIKQEGIEGMAKIYRPYDYFPSIVEEKPLILRADLDDIDEILNFYLYLTPKLLLINTALERLLEGESVGGRETDKELLEEKSPYREEFIRLVPPESTKPVAETYEDIQTSLALPMVDDPYRALANWPDYLIVAWSDLRPFTETGEYRKEKERVYLLTSNLARSLPYRVGLSKEDLEEAEKTVKELQPVFLTSLLNLSAFKVALDRAVV
jgi:hypothetical protein